MVNFEYYTPTKVVFGKGTQNRVGELAKAYGATKVLVHYGSGSVVRSGLLEQVLKSLDEAGVGHVELGGVVPNPRLSKVYEGIELCKKEGVDFLLGVGGGSVIDSCKAIGYGLCYDGDVWDIISQQVVPTACAPIASVVTLAAAGSEMSNSCVITKEETGEKRAVNNDVSRPKFAVLNPELTYTLPPYQTASGCVDIMSHTLERYFSDGNDVMLTDGIAEALLKTIMVMSKRALENPEDYEARANIMWAGSLSHNNLTGSGRGTGGRAGDWACHQLEHELSGMYDVAHGAGLAAVWGGWSRYVMPMCPARFARFARNVMGVTLEGTDEEVALAGIVAFEEFLRSINMPTTISEMGIELTDEIIDQLAWMCTFKGKRTIGAFKVLGLEEIKDVYRLAK